MDNFNNYFMNSQKPNDDYFKTTDDGKVESFITSYPCREKTEKEANFLGWIVAKREERKSRDRYVWRTTYKRNKNDEYYDIYLHNEEIFSKFKYCFNNLSYIEEIRFVYRMKLLSIFKIKKYAQERKQAVDLLEKKRNSLLELYNSLMSYTYIEKIAGYSFTIINCDLFDNHKVLPFENTLDSIIELYKDFSSYSKFNSSVLTVDTK